MTACPNKTTSTASRHTRFLDPSDVPGGPGLGALASQQHPQVGTLRGAWLSPAAVASRGGVVGPLGWSVWLADMEGHGIRWLRRRVEHTLEAAQGSTALPLELLAHVAPGGRFELSRLTVDVLEDEQVVDLSRYIARVWRVADLLGLELDRRFGGPEVPSLRLLRGASGDCWCLDWSEGRVPLGGHVAGDTWEDALDRALVGLAGAA